MFTLLWAILLFLLLLLSLLYRRPATPVRLQREPDLQWLRLPRAFTLVNLVLALLICAFGFVGLKTVFGRLTPFVEVEAIRRPWPSDGKITIGKGAGASLRLPNPVASDLHLGLTRVGPHDADLLPLSADRRVEVNGLDAGAVDLERVAALELDGQTLRPISIGLTGVTFSFARGEGRHRGRLDEETSTQGPSGEVETASGASDASTPGPSDVSSPGHSDGVASAQRRSDLIASARGPSVEVAARGRFSGIVLSLLPGVREKYELDLGWIDESEGLRLRAADDRPSSGPRVRIFRRAGRSYVGYSSPRDRAGSRLRVLLEGQESSAFRSLRSVPSRITDQDELSLGYARYRVAISTEGLEIVAIRRNPRLSLPLSPVFLGSAPREGRSRLEPESIELPLHLEPPMELWLSATPSRSARISMMTPGYTLTAGAEGPLVTYAANPGEDAAGSKSWKSGAPLRLSDASGGTVTLRYYSRFSPGVGGLASSAPFAAWWRSIALCGLIYLSLTALLLAFGLLSPDNFVLYHLTALLLSASAVLLAQLGIFSGDLRLEGYGPRQLRALAYGCVLLVVGCLWIARDNWLPKRQGYKERPQRLHPFDRLEAPIWPSCPFPGGLIGRLARQPRVWTLYILALLLLLFQLPFGEAGIAVPGLASVQPIEAVKTLLLVYFAFWTVRALETKATRLNRPEGLADRALYLAHTLPILLILALSYGLDDVSPILIFALFMYLMYRMSLVRPARGTERGRRLFDSLWLESLILLIVLPFLFYSFVLPLRPSVFRRFLVWENPWHNTGQAQQIVSSLWSMLGLGGGGGLFGAGLGTANGSLPPAVQDDFILAFLGNRLGFAGLALLLGSYVLWLLSGLRAMRSVSIDTRADLESEEKVQHLRSLMAGALFLFIIQLVIVFGSVTGALPVVGQPLPFLSSGGSHLVFFCLPLTAILVLGGRWRPRAFDTRRRRWV